MTMEAAAVIVLIRVTALIAVPVRIGRGPRGRRKRHPLVRVGLFLVLEAVLVGIVVSVAVGIALSGQAEGSGAYDVISNAGGLFAFFVLGPLFLAGVVVLVIGLIKLPFETPKGGPPQTQPQRDRHRGRTPGRR